MHDLECLQVPNDDVGLEPEVGDLAGGKVAPGGREGHACYAVRVTLKKLLIRRLNHIALDNG